MNQNERNDRKLFRIAAQCTGSCGGVIVDRLVLVDRRVLLDRRVFVDSSALLDRWPLWLL